MARHFFISTLVVLLLVSAGLAQAPPGPCVSPMILRPDISPKNSWQSLALQGTTGNRLAPDARVTVTAGDLVQTDEVRSGGSYLSQSDLRLQAFARPSNSCPLSGFTRSSKAATRWRSTRRTTSDTHD